jgi:flagellar biosynthesis/type III secretory pathway protein FliH
LEGFDEGHDEGHYETGYETGYKTGYEAGYEGNREGGYEGGYAMIYFDRPIRLVEGTEELIVSTVHELLPREFLVGK